MIKIKKTGIFFLLIIVVINSGCGTIFGGAKYNARVEIPGHPNAMIFHKGVNIGTGSSFHKVKRKDANKLTYIVREEGCDEQEFSFKFRKFRGWSLTGSIVTWTSTLGGVPFPFGTLIDLATGALWKPNVYEKGIVKENYKNYRYTLNYTGCNAENNFIIDEPNTKDVILLKNGSIIKGQIIEMVPFEYLKLKISDESIITLKTEEIERILKQ